MFAHRFGSAWEVLAPAKLNLFLDVLGPRADGFHNLESLLVPVRLYDHLRWVPASQKGERLCLEVHSQDHHNAPPEAESSNLVLRSASRLAKAAGIEPHGTFRLYKRIPMQAGMGGGSSDAAATLILANNAWGLGYSRQQLAEVAAEVGSDVPFFLANGAAVCRGRGEIVEPIGGLPHMHFVVVKPRQGLSTADVFARWREQLAVCHSQVDAGGLGCLVDGLRKGWLSRAGRWMTNGLEAAAATILPAITDVRRLLEREGITACLMTGSGSAYYGLANSAVRAKRIARHLSGMFEGHVLAVSSC